MSDVAAENWRAHRARLAVTTRHHPDQDHAELRRTALTERALARIEEIVASAPPLTPDQIDRLRRLLPPVRTNGGGDESTA